MLCKKNFLGYPRRRGLQAKPPPPPISDPPPPLPRILPWLGSSFGDAVTQQVFWVPMGAPVAVLLSKNDPNQSHNPVAIANNTVPSNATHVMVDHCWWSQNRNISFSENCISMLCPWTNCKRQLRRARSANRQGEEQHRHTERGSHTRRNKGEHSKQGGGAQQGRRGNQNSGNREAEWSGWQSVRMGGSDNKGDGLASQPRRYRVPGHVSRSPDGLFAQQEREPIRGRPAVRGKRTWGGRLGQRMEEQGTWASRTQKHSKAGYGRPVDRGAWPAKTVKRPRQQPAHPQYANYWAPLTRKRRTIPHSAQPQHTNYWAERGNDTSKSTGRSGRQKAATRRNMRREERVPVQGPAKEQQQDGMSHRGMVLATWA